MPRRSWIDKFEERAYEAYLEWKEQCEEFDEAWEEFREEKKPQPAFTVKLKIPAGNPDMSRRWADVAKK